MPTFNDGDTGAAIRVLLNATGIRRNNFAASAIPAVGDDTVDGYEAGSLWYVASGGNAGQLFFCQSAATGAAVWVRVVIAPVGTADLLDAAVTFAKMQNGTTMSVLGRSANSTGVMALMSADTDGHALRRAGTSLGFGTLASGAFADNTIAPARITNQAAVSVLGRSANSTGAVAAIAASANNTVLRRTGDTVNFGAVPRAAIEDETIGTGLGTTGTVNLDVTALNGTKQRVTLTGNPTFTTSNRVAGKRFKLRLAAGASVRTLGWPAGWNIAGALPTSLAANKVLWVTVECDGTADTDIDATAVAQP